MIFALIWYALIATIFLLLSIPLIIGASATFLVLCTGAYIRASRAALGAEAVPVPQPEGVPAYVHYLSGPAGRDLRQIADLTWREMREQAEKAQNWLRSRFFRLGVDNYRRAIGVMIAAGLIAGAVITALVMAVVTLGALLVWGLLFVLAKGLLYTLRAVDSGLSHLRGIKLTCPACHHRVVYPAYDCPNPACSHRHSDVRPGRYGLLRRTCACGERMPTLLVLGSHRMTAYCPHCDAPMAEGAGTAREIVVPMLGATSAGKTRMMLALAETMTGRLAATAADEPTGTSLSRMRDALNARGDTGKTIAEDAVRAYSFNLGRRLVHIYDPPGEDFADSARLQLRLFLRNAHAFVFVVDPFAIPDVWNSLDPVAQRDYQSIRSSQPPSYIFEQVLENLTGMQLKVAATSLAVAVTKSDLTAGLPICDGLEEDVRGWLNDRVGMANMVRSIEKSFGQVRYFHTTARFTAAGVDPHVQDLLTWTLRRNGVN
ncbi:TRAFAC clade GTPase domain-containing protein [Actinoplanes sp. HUAS TT8]|uniref:TRAFAC clade GTPase domain-containing protein n=1 Tax=Actinoplanes sp. HUAS TT8 TaxID=3447453 RepID=UPI003F52816B